MGGLALKYLHTVLRRRQLAVGPGAPEG